MRFTLLALAITLSMVGQAAARAKDELAGTWLEQYKKLQCAPYSVRVQSVQPLRFVTHAVCRRLPKDFAHVGYSQLVVVDTARDELRLFDFGNSFDTAALLLDMDEQGNWYWLSPEISKTDDSRDLLQLAPGDAQARPIARIKAPFEKVVLGQRGGAGCQLLGQFDPARTDNALALRAQALLSYGPSGASVTLARKVQSVLFWHPVERAYAVTIAGEDSPPALLDCAGTIRELSSRDQQRVRSIGSSRHRMFDVASNGDWLVDAGDNPESAIVVFQGDSRRQFGPVDFLPRDCGHPDCALNILFMAPKWSPQRNVFKVEGFARQTVLRTSDFKVVTSWDASNAAVVLLSDSSALELSKKSGVKLRHW